MPTTPLPRPLRLGFWIAGCLLAVNLLAATLLAFEIGDDSFASDHEPSTPTSTLLMPRSGAQATPATGTRPAGVEPRGVSIRDCVRIGPFFAQPSGTQ